VQPEVKAQMAILVAQAIQETLEQRVAKAIRVTMVPRAIQVKLAVGLPSLLCQPKRHQQNKSVPDMTHQPLGETYELRNHTVDYFDLDTGRRITKLAAQQGLGLWT
jgi:hypothetical protein